jgi:hypothetical protein
MSIAKIPLRTLLAYFGLPPDRRTAAVRADARAEVRKAKNGKTSNGGDFHSCFWSDAKAYAAGGADLTTRTAERVNDSDARARLYPQLAEGFLRWWTEKRRWINEEISVIPLAVNAPHTFKEIDGTVKVENLLCLQVGGESNRLIYPYFAEHPPLRPEIARLGLWLMGQAFPQYKLEDMRILDVLRGEPFSIDRHPLDGTEGAHFVERYARMLADWRGFIEDFS